MKKYIAKIDDGHLIKERIFHALSEREAHLEDSRGERGPMLFDSYEKAAREAIAHVDIWTSKSFTGIEEVEIETDEELADRLEDGRRYIAPSSSLYDATGEAIRRLRS